MGGPVTPRMAIRSVGLIRVGLLPLGWCRGRVDGGGGGAEVKRAPQARTPGRGLGPSGLDMAEEPGASGRAEWAG